MHPLTKVDTHRRKKLTIYPPPKQEPAAERSCVLLRKKSVTDKLESVIEKAAAHIASFHIHFPTGNPLMVSASYPQIGTSIRSIEQTYGIIARRDYVT